MDASSSLPASLPALLLPQAAGLAPLQEGTPLRGPPEETAGEIPSPAIGPRLFPALLAELVLQRADGEPLPAGGKLPPVLLPAAANLPSSQPAPAAVSPLPGPVPGKILAAAASAPLPASAGSAAVTFAHLGAAPSAEPPSGWVTGPQRMEVAVPSGEDPVERLFPARPGASSLTAPGSAAVAQGETQGQPPIPQLPRPSLPPPQVTVDGSRAAHFVEPQPESMPDRSSVKVSAEAGPSAPRQPTLPLITAEPASPIPGMGMPSAVPATGAWAAESPAAAVPSHAPPPLDGVDTPSVAGRVHWMIDHGIGEARIRLNPPELGALDVRISMVDEKAYVHLAASHSAAGDLLEAALPRLRDLLSAGGVELGGATVSHQGAERGPARPWDAPPPFTGLPADQEASTLPEGGSASSSGIDLYA